MHLDKLFEETAHLCAHTDKTPSLPSATEHMNSQDTGNTSKQES